MRELLEKRIIRHARSKRVRNSVRGTGERPRMSVFRSGKHLSLQLIDDASGNTIVSASDVEITKDSSAKKTKKIPSRQERATWVGEEFARRALAKGITVVQFDRGSYKYHGLVKVIADSARKSGLVF